LAVLFIVVVCFGAAVRRGIRINLVPRIPNSWSATTAKGLRDPVVISVNRGYLPIYRPQAFLSICEWTATQFAETVYGVPTSLYRAPIGFRFVNMAGA
jgi:hypothetical protein